MNNIVYTYLIRANNLFKIGQSKCPTKRLKQLQTACASKMKLVGFGTEITEKQLHLLYKNKKVSGEWFKLSQKDVQKILQLLNNKDVNNSNLQHSDEYKDFVIFFGKYKGVRLIDMTSTEQMSYVNWIVKQKVSNRFVRKAFNWWNGECKLRTILQSK